MSNKQSKMRFELSHSSDSVWSNILLISMCACAHDVTKFEVEHAALIRDKTR